MLKKIAPVPFMVTCVALISLASCMKNDRYNEPAAAVDPCGGQPGPLFLAMKGVILKSCISCHSNNRADGGMNWAVDCNIVTHKSRIKARAVDENTMPPMGPLSAEDKNKITAWINAGGTIAK